MVAFAILALSLGLLLQIFSRALHTTALSGDYSRAATLAQARLNAVGVDIPLELGSYGGDAPDDFFWQVSITPYEFGDSAWEPPLDAFLVTSVVSWNGKGDNQRRDQPDQPAARGPIRRYGPWHRHGMAPPAKFADKTR